MVVYVIRSLLPYRSKRFASFCCFRTFFTMPKTMKGRAMKGRAMKERAMKERAMKAMKQATLVVVPAFEGARRLRRREAPMKAMKAMHNLYLVESGLFGQQLTMKP